MLWLCVLKSESKLFIALMRAAFTQLYLFSRNKNQDKILSIDVIPLSILNQHFKTNCTHFQITYFWKISSSLNCLINYNWSGNKNTGQTRKFLKWNTEQNSKSRKLREHGSISAESSSRYSRKQIILNQLYPQNALLFDNNQPIILLF